MKRPLIIAHRGASGERPEHTLAAYQLAIDHGADFVEIDVVITCDGVLVARHENELSRTTDVADHPSFAAKRTTKNIDGTAVTGWFTEDFTLKELKTLRAVERIPDVRPHNTRFNGQFEIPTLQEIIDLVKHRQEAAGRRIGLYPETKSPTYFRSIGLPLEERLIGVLHANGYVGRDAPVFLQSFEVGNLRQLRGMTNLRLIQLLDRGDARPFDMVGPGEGRTFAEMATAAGLLEVAAYADGVGVHKDLLVPRDEHGNLTTATRVLPEAHRTGLLVHAWTFRNENLFLPAQYRRGLLNAPNYERVIGDAAAEYRLFASLGIDGVFTDFPGTAVSALSEP